MHGDTKGAFLSDTDTTSLVDTNLVSNGTFDSNTTGWTASGSITVTQDSGRLKMVSGSGNPLVYTAVTCVVGKRYYFQADFEGSIAFHAGPNASSAGDVAYIPYSTYGSSTTRHCFFVATATTMYLVPHVIGTGNTGYIDNVICKLADHDRTRNGAAEANVGGVNGLSSGLAVYGTITRSAVATGADLVAYSGFSANNFLRQPYNSDMEFGTGDFYMMAWIKSTDSTNNQKIITRDLNSTSRLQLYTAGTKMQIYTEDAGSASYLNSTSNFTTGEWICVIVGRKSGTLQMYVNGEFESGTGSNTNIARDLSFGAGTDMEIGRSNTGTTNYFRGSIALARVGGGFPSSEQIKKMYNDEKHLFRENAKATLYGSSNAVTGLAHDDSTDSLHVGTSAGRSEFQGLCRINNTTEAVTTAISASNGLVAEQ
jgi:hypothetical protein